MLGFNGGLIGATRTLANQPSLPGAWTLREQLEAKRANLWPSFTVREDANFSSVSLLLPCNGNDGSTIILDYSGSPKNVSVFGDTKISTAQSKYYGSSIYFDNVGDQLTTPNSSAFNFGGTSQWTVECWARATLGNNALLTTGIPGAAAISLFWIANANGAFGCQFGSGWSWSRVYASANSLIANDTWNHYAFVRSGNTLIMFLNGVARVTNTSAGFGSGFSGTMYIGSYFADYNGDGSWLNGYVNDLRVTMGVARYTANFTPPDSFLL